MPKGNCEMIFISHAEAGDDTDSAVACKYILSEKYFMTLTSSS